MEQGAPGRSLFIVVRGEVEVRKSWQMIQPGQVLALLGPGGLFGEMSLTDAKTSNSRGARARIPTEMFEIDRSVIEQVAQTHPAVVKDLG